MSAKNKRKGSKFEIDVMKWFRSKGYNAERLRLAGSKDEGDLVVYVAGYFAKIFEFIAVEFDFK